MTGDWYARKGNDGRRVYFFDRGSAHGMVQRGDNLYFGYVCEGDGEWRLVCQSASIVPVKAATARHVHMMVNATA